MAAATIGRMQEFNPDNENATAYLERFLMFVEANGITDAKKVPTLLTVIGAKAYAGLVAPALPKKGLNI